MSRRFRNVEFNTIRGIRFFRRCRVKIGNLVFARTLLAEDPQSLSGNSVAFGRNAAAVTEHEERGCRRFLCGHGRSRVGSSCAVIGIATAFFAAQVIHFVRKSLDFSGQFSRVAVIAVYNNRFLWWRWRPVIVAIVAGERRKEGRSPKYPAFEEERREEWREAAKASIKKSEMVVETAEPKRTVEEDVITSDKGMSRECAACRSKS